MVDGMDGMGYYLVMLTVTITTLDIPRIQFLIKPMHFSIDPPFYIHPLIHIHQIHYL